MTMGFAAHCACSQQGHSAATLLDCSDATIQRTAAAHMHGPRCLQPMLISSGECRWQKQGCIFAGSEDADAFDSAGAAAHSIVRDLDTRNYYMFYEAVDKAGRRCVGVATSSDGLHDWQRHPEPVLHASGESNAWDSGGVGSPCAVSMAGGRWRLYYAGKREADSAWRGIGVALSPEDRVVSEAPTSFARRVE